MTVDSYLISSRGGREYNEDYVGNNTDDDTAYFVLADGLGGHQYGELASKCTVETILGCLTASDDDMQTALAHAFAKANDLILALQNNKKARMKSTAVALCIAENEAFWAHMGDSRLYYIHNSRIKAITEDHSVAFKKFKAGEITRAQIATDEDQSSLLRVLGNDCELKIDFGQAAYQSSDAFMLCSDGFWEYITDDEVLFDYLKASTAREWAELMLLRIMERTPEDNDNLSVITVYC